MQRYYKFSYYPNFYYEKTYYQVRFNILALKTCGIAGKTLFLQRLNEIIYIRYGQKRIYEFGEAHKVSPYYG